MNDDLIATFVAVTGSTEDQATQMLQATNYELEEAVSLFYAAGMEGEEGTHAEAAAGGPSSARMPDLQEDEDDEAIARRLQEDIHRGPAAMEEEPEIRAPIPARTERLYGEHMPAPIRPRHRAGGVPETVVDAFRDFRSAGGGGVAPSGGVGTDSRLSTMYEPPRDILFVGGFDEAKAQAASEGKWLLVNFQSTTQFASHQLNRDTWGDATLKELVRASFVLLQVYDISDEGQKLLGFYKIYELPTIVVVDPLTGAPMRQWTGFKNAERLMEDLMPFLDTPFTDPAASRLAVSAKRKKAVQPTFVPDESPLHAAVPRGARQPQDNDFPPDADENAALQRALEESARASRGTRDEKMSAGGGGGGWSAARGDEVAEVQPPGTEAKTAAEAAARLPEEPQGTEGCRIAVRFPDGRRAQRRFPRDAPLSTVVDWCVVQVPEAASGRSFFLSEALPGAAPLTNLSQSFDAAGVADTMLVMKWAE